MFAQLPQNLKVIYNSAEKIREKAVNHIVEFIDCYRDYFDDDLSINAHVEKLYCNREWADNVIILATSRVLHCNLMIIRSDGEEPTVFHQENSDITILLGYQVGLHYQYLQLDETRLDSADNIYTIINETDIDENNPLVQASRTGLLSTH